MSFVRTWKSLVYPRIPSVSPAAHGKRRKGLWYRACPLEILECQKEQDRKFWSSFLHPQKGGQFREVGGDGIIGSQTLGLELDHGWTGTVQVEGARALERAKKARKCRVGKAEEADPASGPIDLLAIHQPARFPWIWNELHAGRFRPRWMIVENREPDPQWCRLLEGAGYRLRFYFHDDEYYEFKA